ncbi:MAG: mechanosensitive ion channel [Sedimentisphaerales bacterium]|nr:mechanosensitive ion channel [Sedimentisphaerales bacterium]
MRTYKALVAKVGLAVFLVTRFGVTAARAAAGGDPNEGAGGTIDLTKLNVDTVEAVWTRIYTFLAEYGLKIVGAIIIFVVGRWVARLLAKLAGAAMTRAKMDEMLVRFVKDLCYVALLTFVIIAAMAQIGIQTASFIALIAAAGLAVGLALQGSLANFAAGVLMLIFKPIRVGDFVEVGGVKGTVKDVAIFTTVLSSPDNVRIIVPNAQVMGGTISNYTINGTRRLDMVFGISYEDDLKKAKQVIETVLAADERILADPAPVVAVSALADSSVNFVVRPWVKVADYWNTWFDLTAGIKVALEENGITIPFPQHDVHLKDGSMAATPKSHKA